MMRLDLDRFGRDYMASLNEATAKRPPLAMVGQTFSKPLTSAHNAVFNDVLEQASREQLELSIHQTEKYISIIAYTSIRRSLRQVS